MVAYIDYAKAFDSVSHAKLLIKLRACGIAGNLLKWIESFLSNRSQQTRIGATLSNSILLSSGVIQGSVLGPLLFLLFINDISSVLCDSCCTCKLYADDLKLYTKLKINEDSCVLQNKLQVLYDWSNTWQLRISHKKCAVMMVPRHPDICLKLGNESTPFVNEFKDLGVVINSNVKFNAHINTIVARASSRANLIHKCFISKDVQTLVHAFTYILSFYLSGSQKAG